VFLEYMLGAIKVDQVINWAGELLTSLDPLSCCPEIISIAELKQIEVTSWKIQPDVLLKEIVEKYYADFKVRSVESDIYAKACLREKCAELLLGKLTQPEFFAVVSNIYEMFKNPLWLGNLYHIASISEIYTNPAVFETELKKEIKKRLTEL